jgi:hypothetical protein
MNSAQEKKLGTNRNTVGDGVRIGFGCLLGALLLVVGGCAAIFAIGLLGSLLPEPGR